MNLDLFHKLVQAEAERFGCHLEPFPDGKPVRQAHGAFEATLAIDGPHGRRYYTVAIDDELGVRYPEKEHEVAHAHLVRREAERGAAMVRSAAMVPADVAIVAVGSQCPLHGSALVHTVDWEGWTVRCSHHGIHALPGRVARWERNVHVILKRPDALT